MSAVSSRPRPIRKLSISLWRGFVAKIGAVDDSRNPGCHGLARGDQFRIHRRERSHSQANSGLHHAGIRAAGRSRSERSWRAASDRPDSSQNRLSNRTNETRPDLLAENLNDDVVGIGMLTRREQSTLVTPGHRRQDNCRTAGTGMPFNGRFHFKGLSLCRTSFQQSSPAVPCSAACDTIS